MNATATNDWRSFLSNALLHRTRCARCSLAASHNRCHPFYLRPALNVPSRLLGAALRSALK
jgi:hypothetical protein